MLAKITRCYDFVVQRRLEEALAQAGSSPEATAFAQEVSQTIERVNQLVNNAQSQLRQARFTETGKHIAEAEDLQADSETLQELKTRFSGVETGYTTSLEMAQTAWSDRDLATALTAAAKSLQQCPESPEAQTLVRQLGERHEQVNALLRAAAAAMKSAAFDKADSILADAERQWPGKEGLENAKETLAQVRATYREHVGHCHRAQKEKELSGALNAAKSALDVCPDSQEASQLVTTVRNDQSASEERQEPSGEGMLRRGQTRYPKRDKAVGVSGGPEGN